MEEFQRPCCIRGYHTYKDVWEQSESLSTPFQLLVAEGNRSVRVRKTMYWLKLISDGRHYRRSFQQKREDRTRLNVDTRRGATI